VKNEERTGTDFIFSHDIDLKKGFVKSLDCIMLKAWGGLAPVGDSAYLVAY